MSNATLRQKAVEARYCEESFTADKRRPGVQSVSRQATMGLWKETNTGHNDCRPSVDRAALELLFIEGSA
jgi:hypothetical protein